MEIAKQYQIELNNTILRLTRVLTPQSQTIIVGGYSCLLLEFIKSYLKRPPIIKRARQFRLWEHFFIDNNSFLIFDNR